MQAINCSVCNYRTRFISLLFKHYDRDHAHEPNFLIECGIDGCLSSYRSVPSLRKHVSRKHKALQEPVAANETEEMEEHESVIIPEPGRPVANIEHVIENSLTKFILSMRERKGLTESSMASIIDEYSSQILSGCFDETERIVKSKGLTSDDCNDILRPLKKVLNDHSETNTVHKQRKHFEAIGHIPPKKVELGDGDSLYYVSIVDTLRKLLSHDDILSHVLSKRKNTGNVDSFSSGTSYFTNDLFKREPHALQIQLYVDDFQIVNPLGNRTKTHKICGFYWILGNLPSHLQSKLYTIQLAILTQSRNLKQYGYERIMKCMMDDLKILEEVGISIAVAGDYITMFGTVSMLIADNLACHEIGGYFENFSSSFKSCRFCNATRESRSISFDEKDFELSTPVSYNAKIANLQSNPNLATAYGLKRNSELNNLKYYHICWGCPSDIAHDLFEGFALDLMKVTIQTCLEHKCFTVEYLNEKIETFPYMGADSKNRPVKLIKDSNTKITIKQTAAQSLCLLKMLPLFIGDMIPDNAIYWQLYCDFLDALDYILSPSLNEGEISLMELMISKFLRNFFIENTNLTVKPKCHYLVHLATQFRVFGPPILRTTLRFEGKHSYFKSVMARSKNYRNPCKTMSERHQYLQSLYHRSPSYLAEEETEFSKKFSDVPVALLDLPISTPVAAVIGDDMNIKLCSFVKFKGIDYRTNMAVIIDNVHDFEFGEILHTTSINGTPYCVLRKLCVEMFSWKMHSYVIRKMSTCSFMKIENLLSPFPLSLYQSPHDDMYHLISLRHYVPQRE